MSRRFLSKKTEYSQKIEVLIWGMMSDSKMTLLNFDLSEPLSFSRVSRCSLFWHFDGMPPDQGVVGLANPTIV